MLGHCSARTTQVDEFICGTTGLSNGDSEIAAYQRITIAVDIQISVDSIAKSVASRNYGMALSGAFSYLDRALGCTVGSNKIAMRTAIKKNLTVFVRAMLGYTEVEMPGKLNSWKMLYQGEVANLEDILYSLRCNIQHDAVVDVITCTENEIGLDSSRNTVRLPVVPVIRGLLAVAHSIEDGQSVRN